MTWMVLTESEADGSTHAALLRGEAPGDGSVVVSVPTLDAVSVEAQATICVDGDCENAVLQIELESVDGAEMRGYGRGTLSPRGERASRPPAATTMRPSIRAPPWSGTSTSRRSPSIKARKLSCRQTASRSRAPSRFWPIDPVFFVAPTSDFEPQSVTAELVLENEGGRELRGVEAFVDARPSAEADLTTTFNFELESPPANRDGVNPEVYYYGVFSPTVAVQQYCRRGCVLGLGTLTGVSEPLLRGAIGLGFAGELSASTAAHEMGHAHGRPHAPCDILDEGDPDYPHPDAQLGRSSTYAPGPSWPWITCRTS